ncbi:hypothetical protein [Enterococcus bulliens]
MKLRQLFLLQKIKTTITVLLIGLQAITQTLAALILALAINDLIAKELQSFFIQIGWVILM